MIWEHWTELKSKDFQIILKIVMTAKKGREKEDAIYNLFYKR